MRSLSSSWSRAPLAFSRASFRTRRFVLFSCLQLEETSFCTEMAEFKTPTSKKFRSRLEKNPEFETPIKIPASPFLKQIGYGCGVNVFTLERSPRVGHARSPWAVKKRNNRLARDTKFDERIRLEADILRKLKHPNIVGFRGFAESQTGDPCLIMEQLDVSLGDMIEERVDDGLGAFSAESILKVGFEVAKGLEYLHHNVRILHGDIKSYNVLVSKNLDTVKLCDFGVSVPLTESLDLDKTNSDFVYTGTECWNAPEVIFETGPITNKTDVWAYGLVLWEMIALSPPHVENGDESMLDYAASSPGSSMEVSLLERSDQQISEGKENSDPNYQMDDSMLFLEEKPQGPYGTRPPLPAIHIGPEYSQVLEIFVACTDSDHKTRPSAKGLVMFYKNYVKSETTRSDEAASPELDKLTNEKS